MAAAAIFLGLTAAQWTAVAAVATVGVTTWSVIEQNRQAKKKASAAKKLASQQLAAQSEYAGEHLALTEKQMQLQTRQRQIDTLADLITSRGQDQGQVYTLPPAKKYSAVDEFNMAIDRLLRG